MAAIARPPARIIHAIMAVLDPESTRFQCSEAWARWRQDGGRRWRQQWVPCAQISDHLKRVVIAWEDDNFVNHDGVDWGAIEKAWERNAQAAKAQNRAGERTPPRKGPELVLTYALEHLLTKRRILEIDLNNVEWGEGVFGAEAAAQHDFKKSAAQLGAWEAARLAVTLPRPRYFEQRPRSAYLNSRTSIIAARMRAAELP